MTGLNGSKLVVASHNQGKIREIRELLEPFGLEVVSAADLDLPEPEETGSTFEANAELKAVAAVEACGLPCLADDSGLVVDALDGQPGIHSARWAGPERDFAMAMRNIEEKLQQKGAVSPEQRTGRFVAVMCLARPDGSKDFFRGEVEGHLVWPPRGSKGFGYDPVFQPEGYDVTFGEMAAEDKHGWQHGQGASPLSHRARAFEKLALALLPKP